MVESRDRILEVETMPVMEQERRAPVVFVEAARLDRPRNWVPVGSIDKSELGYWLRQARRFAGNKTQAAVATQAKEQYGAKLSASSISAWENGDSMPSLDDSEVLLAIYSPPGGRDWFAPAYSPKLRRRLGLQILPGVDDPWPVTDGTED
jgi:hypothetical protein